MDLRLQGDVAVVVGGARGIGWAIASRFAQEGASVAIVDRDAEVESRAAELRADPRSALGLRVDVTDYAAVQRAAAEVLRWRGSFQHVVFAAGAGSGKFGFPFWNLEPADWTPVLSVCLLGAVHTAHAFTPQLVRQGRGSMTLIGSVAGQIGSQTDPPYSAAKAALVNFAQCMAKDLAPYNVRVNTVSPGMVQTALNRSVWEAWNARQPPESRRSYEDWAGEKVRRVAPLGRWQSPEDIAAATVFLTSPLADNITGQTLNVDGGQVMHS